MTSFYKLYEAIDVNPLVNALIAKDYLYDQIKDRQETPGSPHTDTHTIFLRWAKEQTIDAVFNELNVIDYPALVELPVAREFINIIMHLAGSDHLGRVIIASLKPGGFITPHADEGIYADYYERFHLVLTSENGNNFMVKNDPQYSEHVSMRPGELWWFNHKKEHAVENNSDQPRVHMIVDCVAPLFRRERN